MELTGSENRMSTSSSSSCTSTLSPFFIQVACKNYSSLVRSGAEVGSGKAWPSLLQDAGGRVAEAGEPAALPQDPSPLGTIPAPRLAPLSLGNTSIPYGVSLVRLTVRVRTGKSCQHRPLIPWQEGTWLSSGAHVSMARLPGTGFPTVTQGHDCTGALTS